MRVHDVEDAAAPITAINLYLPVLLGWLAEKEWVRREIPFENKICQKTTDWIAYHRKYQVGTGVGA
jgi:hypothetical protein